MNDKSPGIRLGDLAREAKVSAATVSRFMGGSAEVSPETSKRIIRAAKLLGFDLGGGKKSRIIAFLLSNRGVLHTLHSSILIGAHNYCAEHNYGVLFLSFKYLLCTPSGELELPEILQNKQTVAGVILAGANSESLLHLLSKRRMPWAALGNNVFGDVQDQAGMVYFDDFGGAYDLTRYLQSLGHRHIGFIGSQSFPWYVRRYEAYERAMKDAGLAVRCCDLNVLQSGGEMGYLATKLMLQESPPPTAFFAADDALAGGAYKAIRDSGLSVPEDISVVGFNDSIEASSARREGASSGWQSNGRCGKTGTREKQRGLGTQERLFGYSPSSD